MTKLELGRLKADQKDKEWETRKHQKWEADQTAKEREAKKVYQM